MKTILMWLLGFVVVYVLVVIIGVISGLYNGDIGWHDGWFVALDENGQVLKPDPQVKPTEEEVQQFHEEYQEERSNKSFNLCFLAFGIFIIGWLTGNPQCRTVSLLLLIGAGIWDYQSLGVALFFFYIIIPALVVMAIIGLLKRD